MRKQMHYSHGVLSAQVTRITYFYEEQMHLILSVKHPAVGRGGWSPLALGHKGRLLNC